MRMYKLAMEMSYCVDAAHLHDQVTAAAYFASTGVVMFLLCWIAVSWCR